jgi:hypothetical protein
MIGGVAAIGLALASSSFVAGEPIADLADNEGIFVDVKTFKVHRGTAKTDPSAQIMKLGARPVSEGAIIFRSGDKLYIVDATPAGGVQLFRDAFGSSGWWEQMDREGRGGRR